MFLQLPGIESELREAVAMPAMLVLLVTGHPPRHLVESLLG